ncbi:MAG: hypothetical protein JWP81_3402 [Ferruginibacter sp.]|nr:hypothetical protein [Ferruginibacter sp.]
MNLILPVGTRITVMLFYHCFTPSCTDFNIIHGARYKYRNGGEYGAMITNGCCCSGILWDDVLLVQKFQVRWSFVIYIINVPPDKNQQQS